MQLIEVWVKTHWNNDVFSITPMEIKKIISVKENDYPAEVACHYALGRSSDISDWGWKPVFSEGKD